MFWSPGGAPNYYPNSFSAPEMQPRFVESKFKVSPDVARYNSADEDNVTQVKMTLAPTGAQEPLNKCGCDLCITYIHSHNSQLCFIVCIYYCLY